jgi:hypothetical protein
MAFPSSPTNGQTAVVNGITYTYSTTTTAWTRVTGGNISSLSVSGPTTLWGNLTSTGNLSIGGYSNVFIVNGSATNVSALTISGNVYGRGGVGYLDAITLTNSYSGATAAPNKWIRLDSTGQLQIINSAYNNNIFNLTDAGVLTVATINATAHTVNGNVAVNGPAFQAYLLTGQVTSSGTSANVLYNGKLYDTASCFNTTTGIFTPNVAGYYQFNWTAGANSYPSSSGIVISSLYKNTIEYARGARLVANTGGMVSSGSSSCYLNGVTDFVYIKFLQASSGSATLESDPGAVTNGGSYCNYFSGSMVRGA